MARARARAARFREGMEGLRLESRRRGGEGPRAAAEVHRGLVGDRASRSEESTAGPQARAARGCTQGDETPAEDNRDLKPDPGESGGQGRGCRGAALTCGGGGGGALWPGEPSAALRSLGARGTGGAGRGAGRGAGARLPGPQARLPVSGPKAFACLPAALVPSRRLGDSGAPPPFLSVWSQI